MRTEAGLVRIFLIRHGEVLWNHEHAYAGQTDLPLNELGLAQAETVADFLANKGITGVYSSDLMRARQTAEATGNRIGLPVTTVRALREVNYGEWEGLTEAEIAAQYPETYPEWRLNAANVRIPGGETFAELKDRAYPAFTEIALSQSEGNIAIVAHKSVNRTILCHLLGADVNRYRSIAQENACTNTIQVRDSSRFVVENINVREHLDPRPSPE